MVIKQCILTKNDCYKRGAVITPQGVMVHSTGANNPNLRRYLAPDDGTIGKNDYDNDWNRSGLDVCVHAFIGKTKDGKVAVYQTLPWNRRGWHCARSGNNTHIAFEICEDSTDNKAYMQETYKAAVELTAYLCKTYGLDPMKPGVVVSHKEGAALGIASNHGDPNHWWDKYGVTMDGFRADVKKAMGQEQPKAPEIKKLYRVRKTWGDAKSQIGAFAILDNAKKACKPEYTVFDETGKAVFTPAKKSVDEVAREVIRGNWGNGQERVRRLTEAGYDAAAVQKRVNSLL